MSEDNRAYEQLLCGHLTGMVHWARRIPADKFDFTFAPPRHRAS